MWMEYTRGSLLEESVNAQHGIRNNITQYTLNACNLPLLHSFGKGKFCHQPWEIPQAETYIAKRQH